MELNDFVTHANYVFKTEQKMLQCIELPNGFIVRLERRDIGNAVPLTNQKLEDLRFKSFDSVFSTLEKAGYEGVVKIGVNREE